MKEKGKSTEEAKDQKQKELLKLTKQIQEKGTSLNEKK